MVNPVRDSVAIDVRGASMSIPELVCRRGGTTLRFVIDPGLKAGVDFQLTMFFSKKVLADDVLEIARGRRIGVLNESPIDASYAKLAELERRFRLLLTHQRDLVDRGPPYASLLFGTNWLAVRDEAATAQVMAEHPEKTGLVSFIGSLQHPDTGAYRLRREVASCLVARGDVACFGRGLREVQGKREAIAPYRFSVAMENAASDYYFSEKLVDCVLLEAVPIYYGCDGIGDLLDPRGLLRFRTVAELAAILDGLTPERYEAMRPFILANKARVVAERWHNHAGLLARAAEALPAGMLAAPVAERREQSALQRVFRRMSRMFVR